MHTEVGKLLLTMNILFADAQIMSFGQSYKPVKNLPKLMTQYFKHS